MKRELQKQIIYLLITRLEDWMARDLVGGCETWVRTGEKSCWGKRGGVGASVRVCVGSVNR